MLFRSYERLVQAESQNAEDPNLFLGQLLHDYGDLLGSQKKFEVAVEQYLKSLPIRRTNPDGSLTWTLRTLGSALIECSKPAEAERYLRESVDIHRTLHQREDVYGTAWATMRLADALAQLGKSPEAERSYRDALLAYRKCNATDSDEFHKAVKSLVALLKSEGKLPEAHAVLDEVSAQRQHPSRE